MTGPLNYRGPDAFGTPSRLTRNLRARTMLRTKLPTSRANARPTGTITVLSGQSGLAGGETITIDDGRNVPTTFEVEINGGGVSPGNVAISVTTGMSAAQVKTLIEQAIATVDYFDQLEVAQQSESATKIRITSYRRGTLGARRMVTSSAADFTVDGLRVDSRVNQGDTWTAARWGLLRGHLRQARAHLDRKPPVT